MNLTKDEFETIVKICERAEGLNIAPEDRFTLINDIRITHESMGLNLKELLKADDLNFSHDVVGIQTHINRETREIDDFFVPRYARGSVDSLIDKATETAKVTENNDTFGIEDKNLEQ